MSREQVASEWLAALLAEARAEAWDEGYEAGHATARAVNAEYPEGPANPYRRAESGRCAECRSKGWHKMDCSQRWAES